MAVNKRIRTGNTHSSSSGRTLQEQIDDIFLEGCQLCRTDLDSEYFFFECRRCRQRTCFLCSGLFNSDRSNVASASSGSAVVELRANEELNCMLCFRPESVTGRLMSYVEIRMHYWRRREVIVQNTAEFQRCVTREEVQKCWRSIDALDGSCRQRYMQSDMDLQSTMETVSQITSYLGMERFGWIIEYDSLIYIVWFDGDRTISVKFSENLTRIKASFSRALSCGGLSREIASQLIDSQLDARFCYAWSIRHALWNKLMHSIHGNGRGLRLQL